jgi:two-component system, response regulator RegA
MEKANSLQSERSLGGGSMALLAGLNRTLVVDSDLAALHAICSKLSAWSDVSVQGVSDARQALHEITTGVDLLLIDVAVPEVPVLEIVEAAFAQRISPAVVAMGVAPAAECVFELAKAGVHAYIEKPVQVAQIEACLCPLDVDLAARRLLRPFVGHLGMKDIQTHVREVLVREALERSGGSRRSAAQLLGVTRPAIQRWLRRS